MKFLVIILVSAVVVRGYRNGRTVTSYGSDFLAYQRMRQQTPFPAQQQPFRHYSTTTYQHPYGQQQSYKAQQSYRQQSQFKNYSPFGDYSSYKNPPYRRDQYAYRNLPSFSEDRSPSKAERPFKDQQFEAGNLPYRSESTYKKRYSFSDPLFADEISKGRAFFKEGADDYKERFSFRDPLYTEDLSAIKEKSPFNERPTLKDLSSYEQLSTFTENPQNFANSMPPVIYHDETSDHSTNSYGEQRQAFQNESQDFSALSEQQRGQMPDKSKHTYQNQEQRERQPLSFGGHANYLKYGNHGLGFASVPAVSSYENPLPLETETSTSATTPLASSNLEASVSSTVAGNVGELHSGATTAPKIATTSTTAQSTLRSNTINLAELRSTASTIMSTTLPPVSQQNSVELNKMVGIPTMTTKSPLSTFDQKMHYRASETSTTPAPQSYYMADTLKGNDQSRVVNYQMPEEPKHHAKNGMPSTSMSYLMQEQPKYTMKSNVQGTMLNYVMPQEAKNGLSSMQSNMQGPIINYVMPQDMKNGMNENIQGNMMRYMLPERLNTFKGNMQDTFANYLTPEELKNSLKHSVQGTVVNYLVSEEGKHNLKDNMQESVVKYLLPEDPKHNFKSNIQGSVLNYFLPEEPKRTATISFPESAPVRPEAFNYLQLAIAERPKFSLPANIPIASTLSAVSRPGETINYHPTTSLPRVAFVTNDATGTANLPIGSGSSTFIPRAATLPTGLSLSIGNRLQTNGFPGIITPTVSGSMTGSIPGTISTNIPGNIPTLNFGQSFQQDSGQLRQFGEARSSPFPSGLQLQLGGFGGIEYNMRSASNSIARPLGIGIAKVGLGVPDFPRSPIPTFTKLGIGQQLWPVST